GPDGLFQAPGINLPVRPKSLATPVQVWAGPDAIFVTTPGASIGGEFASRLGGPPPDAPAPVSAASGDPMLAPIRLNSLGIGGDSGGEIRAIMERAHREGRELNADEKARLKQLALPQQQQAKARAPGRTMLASEDANYHAARLRHLCRVIAHAREPFCPANG